MNRLNLQARRTLKSDDAEAVHDLRVAIRRFVQALQVFKSLMPGKERKKARHRLKALMERAGAVRDCDITLGFLGGAKQHKSLRTRCEAERDNAGTLLAKSLSRWLKHHSVHIILEKTISAKETAPKVLPEVTRQCLSRGAAATEGASPAQLHRFRISAKKLRYTVELFASRDAQHLLAWLDQIKKVQTLLGDINDCETARHMASRLGGSKTLDAELKKKLEERIKTFHRHWTPDLVRQWKRLPVTEL